MRAFPVILISLTSIFYGCSKVIDIQEIETCKKTEIIDYLDNTYKKGYGTSLGSHVFIPENCIVDKLDCKRIKVQIIEYDLSTTKLGFKRAYNIVFSCNDKSLEFSKNKGIGIQFDKPEIGKVFIGTKKGNKIKILERKENTEIEIPCFKKVYMKNTMDNSIDSTIQCNEEKFNGKSSGYHCEVFY